MKGLPMIRAAFQILLAAVLAVPVLATAATVEYIHTDALGSPVAVTNSAGQVIERREYEPYGRQLAPTALTNGPGYNGHVTDAATGLTYMQQRYFDPMIGRFLSVDPVTAHAKPDQNFNRYWYANNNPYKFTDPDGRLPVIIPIIAGIIWLTTSEPANAPAVGERTQSPMTAGEAVTSIAEAIPAGRVGSAMKMAANIHGNSKASPKEQHRYEIKDNATGDVKKTGISGRDLNRDGSSGRANEQVNKLNKSAGYDKYSADVKQTGIQGREAGLNAERAATADLKAQGHSLELQRRPDPNKL